MKDLNDLKEIIGTTNAVQQLISIVSNDNKDHIKLEGLKGAIDSFLLSITQERVQKNFLIIEEDKESAAYLLNNIEQLSEHAPLFFPDSFKRPAYFEEINKTNVLQRTETINKFTQGGRSKVIVTYPEAIFEQVVSPTVLKESQLIISKGESLDVEAMIYTLNEFGFTQEDFVYEPGQYAIRGGIIDLFSYGNEYPYRLELFDDEVESIRFFDPSNQLSVKNIQRITLVPNINTQFKQEEKVSILEVLGQDDIIWINDIHNCGERLKNCLEKAELFEEEVSLLDRGESEEIFKDRAFIQPADISDQIQNFKLISYGTNHHGVIAQQTLAFDIQPQPNFNKNFNLLIQDLQNNASNGIKNYIFTDNPKQVERFYAIFADLEASITFIPILKSLSAGFLSKNLGIACYTDHQIFQRFHRFKLRKGFSKDKALNIKMLRELKPGDFVTHIDHGVGQFSGLEKLNINGHTQESVRLFYKNRDVLYVSINSLHKISKYSSKEGTVPSLNKLGSEAWKNTKSKAKKRVKDIAAELIKLYAKRKASPGFAFEADGYLQNELEASFLYEDTPDQLTATNDVKADMVKPHPMDRLVCGDVGFGKTEIAVRAAFKAVVSGKQVAILVPTTILALQHFKTFNGRLESFGVTVDYVNRFKTNKQKKEIYERLKSGKLDILIGTHSILNKQVEFKDLGLLVIDEEQKFGVSAKEKLRNIKVNVDTLTLTATPIPRTLQFSLMAARDLSVIRTAPPNRQPIHTEVRVFSDRIIKESIYYEVNRGGQVFFVHNRVKSLQDIATMVKRLCPDIDIAVAHGQMESKDLERVLLDFIDRKYDVLISTNIIETGLDIPNANTIIINNAHQFGMSDLHQLRGRVGRSNKKAFCYLFCPPMSTLTQEARKRLKTLEEYSDLGSGFNIAMRDLDIRGAGNLLGGEQSGFLNEIGYETYQKILEEAIQELKENAFKELFKEEMESKKSFVKEVHMETDVEMLIPDEYVSNIQERLNLYTKLDNLKSAEDLDQFAQSLTDRFGKIPPQVYELFDGLKLRWICKDLGFERLIIKNEKMRCFFVENPQSMYYETEGFQKLFDFIVKSGYKLGLKFKQTPKNLIVIKEGIPNLKEAKEFLDELKQGRDSL